MVFFLADKCNSNLDSPELKLVSVMAKYRDEVLLTSNSSTEVTIDSDSLWTDLRFNKCNADPTTLFSPFSMKFVNEIGIEAGALKAELVIIRYIRPWVCL